MSRDGTAPGGSPGVAPPFPPPMRVAHLMAGMEGGGAELFFERLTVAAAAAGDAVLAATRPVPGRLARLRAGGLDPVACRFGGILDVGTAPRLGRALRRFRPAVVVAWMGRAARFAPRGDWTSVGRLGGYYDLGRFRRCTHLVANTAPLARWMVREGWPADRVHHLPNFAVDAAGVSPERAGVPPDVPLVLALGRLHANKGFDVLIRALARVGSAHLLIGGDGPERDALAALAHQEGVADRVHLPGWREDAARLLAGSDLFVCSSRHEPLGNVVMEAMAAGRPIVATATEGPADLLAHDRTGLLVPLDDPVPLADAIGALLDDRARAARLGTAARTRWAETHAPAPVLAQWRAGLARIAATGP